MKGVIANASYELVILDIPVPSCSEDEVLVKVSYAGVNRADVLQKKGLYPPPPGVTEVLGLEFSGRIESMGSEVEGFKIGDEVCSIVAGGTYAEYVKVNYRHLIRKPENLTLAEAGVLSEVFITAYQALVQIGKVSAGEQVLIHAGASGVGSAAIQMAKKIGAEVVVTASGGKHEYCRSLGADHCIDYKKNKFRDYILSDQSLSINFILDLVGGSYFYDNLDILALEGRMVMLGFLGGVRTEAGNVAQVVTKRLQVVGSTLRSRDIKYKANLIQSFCKEYLVEGQFDFKINLDKVFEFSEVQKAHQYMEENRNKGKIVVKVAD